MRKIAFATIVFVPVLAHAEFISPADSERFSAVDTALQRVSDAMNLSDDDGLLARKIAAQWVFTGPCEGSMDALDAPVLDAPQIVLSASAETPQGAAILQMITIISRDNLGRPYEFTCRLALAIANTR